jgi:hypothetical protein
MNTSPWEHWKGEAGGEGSAALPGTSRNSSSTSRPLTHATLRLLSVSRTHTGPLGRRTPIKGRDVVIPALQDIGEAFKRQVGHPMAAHLLIHLTEAGTPGPGPVKPGFAGEKGEREWGGGKDWESAVAERHASDTLATHTLRVPSSLSCSTGCGWC